MLEPTKSIKRDSTLTVLKSGELGASPLGRVAKGVKCSVVGCDKQAVRSLPTEKVSAAGLKVGEAGRAYLCKDHHKEFKRGTRRERMLEKWRYKG
ncbi:MAG: hypothetical protein AOA65_0546 [Candidatus Bathyarchaeota archaeon BA1]|nr:MAG: hypothetical protein AOA65_0546 [Candidatus Bathyarchaeota archaeon BA1]